MHRGILLSFYSSAAAFVNGKCACFLPGFLGRAQKSPGGAGRFGMRAACALRISSGKIILNLQCRKICGFSGIAFSRGGIQDEKSPGGRVLSGEERTDDSFICCKRGS